MNRHYRNFTTVVFIPAWVSVSIDTEKLEKDYDFLEKYLGLDKVYLETHRGDIDVDKEQILKIKSFLEGKGVTVSGAITTIINEHEDPAKGRRRIFNTFCYTDPQMRESLKRISEYAAGLFDEVILDDFYFTNCTCESCIKSKGDRNWTDFRRELMLDVSKNLIVDPAKKVNPDVKMVIKYPNWRESFNFTGYLPEAQDEIFDLTYIGTETRSPAYTDQHLPEYLSYSLVRFMKNAWPGKCGGGWYDTYQCWSADRYMEQAYLTAFAQAGELMHFQWGDLIDNPWICALGFSLRKIDKLMDNVGTPTGIPVYIPHASSGENHLEMRLGMLGLPMEPTPVFPGDADKILLTETAAGDPDITDKLARFVQKGGDAVITTGFLARKGEELLRRGLTEARVSTKKYQVTRYHITGDNAGYIEDREPILFPEIIHGNNASWSLLNGGSGDLHTSLFLRSTYGRGRIYIMSVPDNEADLYRMPKAAVDVLKRALLCGGTDTYASGRDFSMFTYDDGSMILYRYVKDKVHPGHVTMHTSREVTGLKDMINDRIIPVIKTEIHEDFEMHVEYTADVILQPGLISVFKWEA
ncbi:MAG: hypothetical protein K6F34_08625 [Lachnospiraceae bacterium]|nr:hypothetical protein [Lachnospiraceae bacterium]